MREPSELWFGVVRGVGRINMSCKGKEKFWGFLFPDLYYRISYCAAARLLLGQFLELHCAWASVSHAGLVRCGWQALLHSEISPSTAGHCHHGYQTTPGESLTQG